MPKELEIVPHTVRKIVTHAPNQQQLDHHLLEKAITVTRITTEQELKRQIVAQKQVNKTALTGSLALIKELDKSVIARQMPRLRARPELKQLAKLLTALFVAKVTAAGLVRKVELTCDPEGEEEDQTFWDQYSEDGTEVGINVELSVSAQVLDRPSGTHIEEDCEDNEDYYGRRTYTANGWFEWTKLSREEQGLLAEAKLQDEAHKKGIAALEDLENRLAHIGEQADALTVQVYRKQIGESEGGKDMLALIDANQAATLSGNFTRLL